jgi:protein TonB
MRMCVHGVMLALALIGLAGCGRSGSPTSERVDTTLPDATVNTTESPSADAVAAPSTNAIAPEGGAPAADTAPTSPPIPEATSALTGPQLITQPDWLRKPTGEDMARYYPDRAQRMSISGRSTVSCTVTEQGTLSACSVIEEEPNDAGFGEAALRMSRLFKMRPQTRDGQPASGGIVRIPIIFTLPGG